jgi:hypothetical protein
MWGVDPGAPQLAIHSIFNTICAFPAEKGKLTACKVIAVVQTPRLQSQKMTTPESDRGMHRILPSVDIAGIMLLISTQREAARLHIGMGSAVESTDHVTYKTSM